MKNFTIILTAAVTAILFAAGCVNEEPAYKKGTGTTLAPNGTGYLSMAGMTMRVIYDDQTDTQPDDTAGATAKPLTRAEEAQPDVDQFIVEIIDAGGTSVYKDTYAALRAEMEGTDGKKELPTGSYTLEVRSEEPSPALAKWDHPVYFATRDFAIEKNKDTVLDEVVCTLNNIKVTVACSKDLADQLTDATVSTVTLGETSMVFAKGETRAAYFTSLADLNTLKFNLTGAFADTPDAPLQFNKEIPNVKAGQWRKIMLVITYADKGEIKFDIEVTNFVLDEEIRIDGTANLWEPVLEEGPALTAPTIEWPGHNLAEPFRITDSMFDADGNCTEPFALDLSAPNGIESFVLTISSTNPAFMDALAEIQLPTSFDLCTTTQGPAYAILSGFGLPLGDKLRGATAKRFDIAGQIPMLYTDPGFEGTHTFACTLTDAKGLSTSAELRLEVSKGSADAPTIVGVGFDIDAVQTPSASDTVIDIFAKAGIRALDVTIDSDGLTSEVLGELGLPSRFNLCNIEGFTDEKGDFHEAADVAAAISELGFPVNDEVKDHTTIQFTISGEFISLLPMVAPGKNNFQLKVTDNAGLSTTKTLQFFTE